MCTGIKSLRLNLYSFLKYKPCAPFTSRIREILKCRSLILAEDIQIDYLSFVNRCLLALRAGRYLFTSNFLYLNIRKAFVPTLLAVRDLWRGWMFRNTKHWGNYQRFLLACSGRLFSGMVRNVLFVCILILLTELFETNLLWAVAYAGQSSSATKLSVHITGTKNCDATAVCFHSRPCCVLKSKFMLIGW